MEFHAKTLSFKIFLHLIYVYQYTIKNFTQEFDNVSFEVYIQILKLCDKYYLVTNIFHTFKFFNVCWNFQNNGLD
jgi:hypothetical protein